MGKFDFEEQTSFLTGYDVESLLADGPLDSCASRMSNASEQYMDLECIKDDMEKAVLPPELSISVNSLDNISSFAGILSPSLEYTEIPDILSVHSSGSSDDTRASFAEDSLSGTALPSLALNPRKKNTKHFKSNKRVLKRKRNKKSFKNSSRTLSSAGSKAGSKLARTTLSVISSSHDDSSMRSSSTGSTASNSSHTIDNWDYEEAPKQPVVTRNGRWSADEHHLFLQGIAHHGRNWDKVAKGVQTRTTVQVRSHAQKYFKKLAHRERLEANRQGSTSTREAYSSELSDARIMKEAAHELSSITL